MSTNTNQVPSPTDRFERQDAGEHFFWRNPRFRCRREATTFTIWCDDGFDSSHSGYGLTLDHILTDWLNVGKVETRDDHNDDNVPYDLVVYEGYRVVAVVHRGYGEITTATRFDRPESVGVEGGA